MHLCHFCDKNCSEYVLTWSIGFCDVCKCMSRQVSSEPIFIKEGAESLLTQLAAFALDINIFLPTPVLLIEYTPNLLYLERKPYSSLLSGHNSAFSLEQGLTSQTPLQNFN
jgi:hypothetical protein